MPSIDATIASSAGLHARPASVFIEAVKKQSVPITISKDGGRAADASSILSLMALGAGHGDVVTLAAEGDGAEAALSELKALLETDLDA